MGTLAGFQRAHATGNAAAKRDGGLCGHALTLTLSRRERGLFSSLVPGPWPLPPCTLKSEARFRPAIANGPRHAAAQVHDLLEQVPLHVEDYPSPQVMAELGVQYRDELCGLYTGIPLGPAEHHPLGCLPDVVTIYREGILGDGRPTATGKSAAKSWHRQIRITILHELGHHHGMTEEDGLPGVWVRLF